MHVYSNSQVPLHVPVFTGIRATLDVANYISTLYTYICKYIHTWCVYMYVCLQQLSLFLIRPLSFRDRFRSQIALPHWMLQMVLATTGFSASNFWRETASRALLWREPATLWDRCRWRWGANSLYIYTQTVFIQRGNEHTHTGNWSESGFGSVNGAPWNVSRCLGEGSWYTRVCRSYIYRVNYSFWRETARQGLFWREPAAFLDRYL